jgi:hypothetical protein
MRLFVSVCQIGWQGMTNWLRLFAVILFEMHIDYFSVFNSFLYIVRIVQLHRMHDHWCKLFNIWAWLVLCSLPHPRLPDPIYHCDRWTLLLCKQDCQEMKWKYVYHISNKLVICIRCPFLGSLHVAC